MKSFSIIIILFLLSASSVKSYVKISELKCEYKNAPLGIDIRSPRFSWILESDKRGIKQTAYQIFVSTSKSNLKNNIADMWNSEKIYSDEANQIYYKGKPLESNRKYFWKVKIWDQDDNEFYSKSSYWTTGLFNESDWKAKWIGLDKLIGQDDTTKNKTVLSARMLRHEFNTNKKILSATAFISGLGLFELYLNGKRIGDQVLAPGLTEYNKRTFYLTFDVTNNLLPNQNTIGVILGNGRYFAPRLNEPTNTRTYGFPKLVCQIEIKYSDGSAETIISDETWKVTTDGPIVRNNEYDGEYYDARKEFFGWNENDFDDTNWINAEVVDRPGEKLVSQPNENIKITEEITPIGLTEIEPGTFIFDMGQNMVGWVELFVNGERGDKVTLRFAETINSDGSLFLDNIRGAEVTDTYILKGDGLEKWEPKFTYHGFRYVEMKGYSGKPELTSILGKVVHDDLEISGTFESSNNVINNVYKNAYWGIRGNYRSIPTDCPQRDERQGWLGDRSAECTGESYIFNISNLYNKWLYDIQDAQKESGSIPDVAPSYWPFYTDNTTWPGTYLFAAEMLYNQYGDLKTIRTHYPYMQKWIEYMSQFLNNGIMPNDTYGDWCVPPEDLKLIHTSDPSRTTSSEYIGTAYFYRELKLMEKFASLLELKSDSSQYANLAAVSMKAFNKKFLDKINLKYSNNSHTVNILALAFDLVPYELKPKIVNNLLEKILGESEGHVGNGIIGGQWLMRTLTDNGHADVAYKLASQTTYPSWGYMVEQGATTIWELWNGDHGDPSMNSGNHVMLLGDFIIWLYENLAGIKADPKNPGFKHVIMKPYVMGDLEYVNASYNSVRGRISSNWKLENNKFLWNISIPANTTATLYIPTLNREKILESGDILNETKFSKFKGWESDLAIWEIGSGNYSFQTNGFPKIFTKPYVSSPIIFPNDTITNIGSTIIADINSRDEKSTIHFTLDGTEPTETSPIFTDQLMITQNTSIMAKAFKDDSNPSMTSNAVYTFVNSKTNGIRWKLYNGAFIKLPKFSEISSNKNGITYQFDLNSVDVPDKNFALEMESHVKIDHTGEYEFYISSNDGSKLYINDKLLIDNDGEHGPKQLSGSIKLEEGKHLLRVEYFQSGGSKTLLVYYSSNEINYQTIPANVLYLNKN